MNDREALESRDRLEPVQRVGDCPHSVEMGRVQNPFGKVIRCGGCGAPVEWIPQSEKERARVITRIVVDVPHGSFVDVAAGVERVRQDLELIVGVASARIVREET